MDEADGQLAAARARIAAREAERIYINTCKRDGLLPHQLDDREAAINRELIEEKHQKLSNGRARGGG